MNVNEQLLTARLQEFSAPGEVEAGERGRRIVLAAFAERTPARRRRLQVAAARLARAGGPAGGRRGRRRRAPAQRQPSRGSRAPFAPVELTSGVVLALGRGVAYAVDARGRVRSLGQATRRRSLTPRQRTPSSRPARRSSRSTSPTARCAGACPRRARSRCRAGRVERTVPPCCRVAYLARGALYVVGGDGRGAHRVAAHALAVAPAWRPAGADTSSRSPFPAAFAYCADGRAARARATHAQRPSRSAGAPTAACSPSSTARGATLYSAAGKRLQRVAVRGGVALDGGFAPVRRPPRHPAPRRRRRQDLLVRGAAGRWRQCGISCSRAVGDLRLSPDGTSALSRAARATSGSHPAADGRQTRLRRVGERLRAGLMPRALAWAG